MKKISVVIPTYNEQENVKPLSTSIVEIFKNKLSQYDYEIIFIDNHSTDDTRNILRKMCNENKKIKSIFNARNFGQMRSPVYGITQSTGDCTIRMCADFQDPVELIEEFVREWENGYKIVIGIKEKSQESKIMYLLRSCYYKFFKKISDIDHIEHFTGFGLYDKKFVEVIRSLNDPLPYLRGIIAELGYEYKKIPFEQPKRKAGKSKNNLYSLYDYAMVGITSYSKVFIRMATMGGFIVALVSFLIGLIYFILKLVYWDRFVAGTAPILIGMFFLGSVQLLFLGLIGEYILGINLRVMNRPLVVEDERLNFESNDIEDD